MRALTAAIELLTRTSESPERDRRELVLQTMLGPVLMMTKGWAAPETERVYLRANGSRKPEEVRRNGSHC